MLGCDSRRFATRFGHKVIYTCRPRWRPWCIAANFVPDLKLWLVANLPGLFYQDAVYPLLLDALEGITVVCEWVVREISNEKFPSYTRGLVLGRLDHIAGEHNARTWTSP